MEHANWISQPNVCRCCLAASGTWDLTVTRTTDAGNNEVLVDILRDCFGISLSCLLDYGVSRLACSSCVKHLQDANSFRKQVLGADQKFLEYYRGLTNVKVKVEDEEAHTNFLGDSPTFMYDDNKEEEINSLLDSDNIVSRRRSPRIRQGQKTNPKAKRKRRKIAKENSVSDATLKELTSKREFLDEVNNVDDKNVIENGDCTENNLNDNNIENVEICFEGPRNIKQVSERKRVMITCDIVLNDTTACPFRHHKSWFQCFFCAQDFMEINLLRNHTLESHAKIDEELKKIKRYPRSLQIDISELKCRHCEMSLTDVDALTRHFESIHNKTIYKECIADYKVNASPYTCHICKREFHVFRTLTTHLNEHYANCICDVCGKSFLNSKRLKVHKRTHENGSYPCSECDKVLKTKTSKANHMESAHSKRVVKCQICFLPMKHYNDRIKHMSEAHNITHKFKCSICSREYNIKHYLATHMRQTHGHKNKKCLECGMAFITNHGLKKHMLRHSGEKPYTCNVCSKSYVRSYTLREHMRVHNADKKT